MERKKREKDKAHVNGGHLHCLQIQPLNILFYMLITGARYIYVVALHTTGMHVVFPNDIS